MLDTLKDTLSKVNDWVKFAEAKNAANVAFCSATIFALTRIITSKELINSYVTYYIGFVILCLILSLSISLFSFIPKLRVPWLHIGSQHDVDNLLYFGHACKYTATDYLEKLYDGENKGRKNNRLEFLYANQIVVNSKVAYIKFKQFDLAIFFTMAAILSPVGVLFVAIMKQ